MDIAYKLRVLRVLNNCDSVGIYPSTAGVSYMLRFDGGVPFDCGSSIVELRNDGLLMQERLENVDGYSPISDGVFRKREGGWNDALQITRAGKFALEALAAVGT